MAINRSCACVGDDPPPSFTQNCLDCICDVRINHTDHNDDDDDDDVDVGDDTSHITHH